MSNVSLRPFLYVLIGAGFGLCLMIGIHGCAGSSGSSAAASVVNATDLGPIPTNPDILGRDGGYSALFMGQSVWLYGDTFLASPNTYDAHAHSEYDANGGQTIYVTYSRATGSFSSEVRLVAVQLEKNP